MRIHITTTPVRRQLQAGDEKVTNGVTYIRQQKKVQIPGSFGTAYLRSYGRPVWEWVVKGSADDRRANGGVGQA